MDWNDLKLFLDVARLGGLSAAGRATGLSPATLGRRIAALETAIGEPLFVRQRTGYHLTPAGLELLEHAGEIQSGINAIHRWQAARHGDRVVRVSAGYWTTNFLASKISELWHPEDNFRVEFVTANEKVDIGRHDADLGIRNARPTEQWLAGQLIGKVTFALYAGRKLIGGTAEGMFVGLSGPAQTPSARWLEAHHGDRIGVRGNDAASIRELVVSGAGLSVLPCFVGDADPRLVRVAGQIPELTSEHWLVSHHDERHAPHVRRLSGRIATLVRKQQQLFRGEPPQADKRSAPDAAG